MISDKELNNLKFYNYKEENNILYLLKDLFIRNLLNLKIKRLFFTI